MPIQKITSGIIDGTTTFANTAISGTITASQLATSLNLATNNVQVASIQTATGTPAITFAANGQITTANAPFILTGGQLQFPGTQSASSDANTLDDYEEGTWTPTISSTGGSITTYTASGTYTKIGRLVHFTLKVNLTTVGSASGNMVVANFPFACGTTNIQSTYIVREGALTGQCYQFYLNSGGTDGILQSLTGSAAGWTNSYAYYGTGTYISA